MDDRERIRLYELMLKLTEGSISSDEKSLLEAQLVNDLEVARQYNQFMVSYVWMMKKRRISNSTQNALASITQMLLWDELAENEKTAPTIEHPEEEPQHELIEKIAYPLLEKQKISKLSLYSALLSVAALLLLVLFVKFAPRRQYSLDVATLEDQMNVKWADSGRAVEKGGRLWTNDAPLQIDAGVLQIEYDNGVSVIVEGPALLEIERSGMYLEYGRLFSRVSASGVGFKVETPSSQFIDLGTEFGIQAEVDGSTELHVIKGAVQLYAGLEGQGKTSRMVEENQAVKYDCHSGSVEDINIKEAAFVRQIDSTHDIRWRGETTVDLADIVGGGNGLGTGRPSYGINIMDGKLQRNIPKRTMSAESNEFIQTGYPFIDGVFVPSKRVTPVKVSSKGHLFTELLRTSISPKSMPGITYEKVCRVDNSYDLAENTSSLPSYPAIFMHSNQGMTFSLEALRKVLQEDVDIQRFSSKLNMPVTVLDRYRQGNRDKLGRPYDYPEVDIYVLLDGVARYQRIGLKPDDGVISIDVDISPEDTFLSLIVVSGGSTNYDWTFLTQPHLELAVQ